MAGVAVLAFFCFSETATCWIANWLQLLRQSRGGYDTLQRLQGRVVQQAKLASLGELVAMAASEFGVSAGRLSWRVLSGWRQVAI